MSTRYTPEQKAWLADAIPWMSFQEAADAFSERFFPITRDQVRGFAKRNRLKVGVRESTRSSIWDDERYEFMRQIIPGHQESEIRAAFLDRFGIELTESQIGNAKTHLGVKSGTHGGRYAKGHVPPNKGRKREEWATPEAIRRMERGQFKQGRESPNEIPIGSEYVDKDGYVYVKVSMDAPRRFGRGGIGKWRQRSHIVYEEATGRKVADDEIIMHANGICGDDSPENLVAVNIRDKALLAKSGVEYADAETLEACIKIIGFERELRRVKKGATE